MLAPSTFGAVIFTIYQLQQAGFLTRIFQLQVSSRTAGVSTDTKDVCIHILYSKYFEVY